MKRIKIVFTMFTVLALIFSACKCDDTKNETNQDSLTNVKFDNIDFGKTEYEVPGELVYGKMGEGFLYDKLYPIGWSKNGLFAYIIEPADEASGLYWFEFVILDVVNNKVKWSWKPKEMDEGSVSKVWKDNYDLFRKNLRESEIVQVKSFSLQSPKTTYNGNEFNIILESKTENDPDFGFDVIKEIDIRILSPELGEKKVLNQKNTDYTMILGAYVPGYIMGLNDDRILIILQKERVGYEGPPNVVYFDLIGTDLARGFKKEKDS